MILLPTLYMNFLMDNNYIVVDYPKVEYYYFARTLGVLMSVEDNFLKRGNAGIFSNDQYLR